jgi:hypothetical protein
VSTVLPVHAQKCGRHIPDGPAHHNIVEEGCNKYFLK